METRTVYISRVRGNIFIVNLDFEGLALQANGLDRAQDIAVEYCKRYSDRGLKFKYVIDCR